MALLTAALPALAQSQESTVASDASADDTQGDIVVLGRGETRQVQTLTKSDLDAQPPAASPIKALEKLPSVNFQSADPLGVNEYSTSISVRSFGQTQLGYTLDGMPLGNMSYGSFNGLHISRAAISENVAGAELAQGAGALDTPASSNLGGTIKFTTVDPSQTLGGEIDAGYGSQNTYRLFARLDTGDLGDGTRAYISGAHLDQPKWKGNGKTSSWQTNAKLISPLGPDTTLTVYGAYSDLATDDYMDVSRSIVDRYGWNWDYLRYDWATAVALATAYQANPSGDCGGNAYPLGIRCVDDTYYDGTTLRSDVLGYLRLESRLSDKVQVRVQPYFHHNRGEGTWWYPYSGTPGGAPLFVRSSGYGLDRWGATAAVTVELGAHSIEAGGWLERADVMSRRLRYGIAADGSNWGHRQWPRMSDAFGSYYDFRYDVRTNQGFLQDTWQVTDALKVTAGFKALDVDVRARTIQTTITQAQGKIEARDLFLPQAGVNYMVTHDFELFGSYAENFSAFGSGPFSTDQASFDATSGDLKPESSRTFEGGLRLHLPRFEGVLAGYHVKFRNRLAGFSPCSVIETCASITSNVGSVTTYGIEAAGTWRLVRHLSLFGSYSYTNAQYDDDTVNGAGEVVLRTRDRQVVGVPRHIANAEVAYDDGTVFGRVGAGYQSRRYYTFLNDASIDGRIVASLSLGVRFAGDGPLAGLEVQGNVTNLFDKNYFATFGSTNSDVAGNYQGGMVGAPRQFFITARKRF
ncbi:TonB-dependent receptor [Sphingomonas gellani]|nr:TonB-dependent receptor [Sphingomonas gellani]